MAQPYPLHASGAEGVALVASLVFLTVITACRQRHRVTVLDPPETRTEAVVEVLHGEEIPDPYRWLEAQEAPETREWIAAQNAYTDTILGQLPGRRALEGRLAELLKLEQISWPWVEGGRYFLLKRGAEQDLYVLYMRQGAHAEDEVLIDPHSFSPDHTTSIDLADVSTDGELVVYRVRQGGEDEVTVRLFEVASRSDLPDVLPRGLYFGVSISHDRRWLFYTRQTADGPRVFRHRLGTDPAADEEIFGAGVGPEKILFTHLSEDGHYLVAHVYHGSSADQSEVHILDLTAAGDGWATVVDDLPARFVGEIGGGRLYLHTNWQAPNGRVLAVPLASPAARESWREVVAERPEAVIESMSLAGGRIFLNYLEDVHSRIVAYGADGSELEEIAFDTPGTVSSMVGKWSRPEAFFAFQSFAVPPTLYRYDISAGEREIWHRVEAPVEPDSLVVEQVWFTSADGTRVPMFLIHRRDLDPGGDEPVLLTGYGGFNVSRKPVFSPGAVVWAEQGGVYAVANLRGGGELGETWHRAGMRQAKQNVFDDFIAAAEWLIDNGYTQRERLAASGVSNGGLLVGAVMTQRPDLFRAVICSYPLLDMLRYHRFLMGPYWVPEYGAADESPEMLAVLRAYSPYHNVVPGTRYPAVLFITGDADTRVAPLHARKMAAQMQTTATSERPVLLRYHTKAGHSGGQPVSEQIENLAESYGFLFWQLEVG